MTMKIGGNSYSDFYGGNQFERTAESTTNSASVDSALKNSQTAKPKKLPVITGETTFTVTNCNSEKQLARAGLMASAAAAGIASRTAQADFADSVLAKGSINLENLTSKTDIADKDVPAMNNQRYTYVLDKSQKSQLEAFRAGYVKDGGKIAAAKNPIINAQTAGSGAAQSTGGITDLNAPRTVKIKVTLPNTGESLADRALLGYAQQKYGQPKTNLWGENIINIRDLARLQNVKPQNLKITPMGNKTVAEFELSPADAAKMQRSYEAVQTEFNRVEAIADNFRNNNELASFLRGFGQGVWDALKSNWDMITDPVGTAKAVFQMLTNPLETFEALKKDLGDKWEAFKAADPSKKAEMLGNLAGQLAVDALLTKGAGKVGTILKETKFGAEMLEKAAEARKALGLKVVEAFSDEAAQAASQRIKQKLATQIYSGIPADLLAEIAVVAGNKIAKGATRYADFAKQMVNEFGEKVKPELGRLYREAMAKLDKIVDEAEVATTNIDEVSSVTKVFSSIVSAPLAKFEDYIFKPGATHGKNKVFESLGYGREHSQDLAKMYEKQAAEKFARREYTLGVKDEYGQRINIEIELKGIGNATGKTSYLKSGWMMKPDGSIALNTPFSGFTK